MLIPILIPLNIKNLIQRGVDMNKPIDNGIYMKFVPPISYSCSNNVVVGNLLASVRQKSIYLEDGL